MFDLLNEQLWEAEPFASIVDALGNSMCIAEAVPTFSVTRGHPSGSMDVYLAVTDVNDAKRTVSDVLENYAPEVQYLLEEVKDDRSWPERL